VGGDGGIAVINWDRFERRVCLSLLEREWTQANAEHMRVGLTNVERFQALPIDADQILGPHQSFNASTRRILQEFHESGAETLLFLEDDCAFRELAHLNAALDQLPPAWDVLYLGANLLLWADGSEPRPAPYSKRLFRVRGAWTTHAIVYRRKVVPFLLDNQPGFSEQMFDNWLSTRLGELEAFVVAPMVAYQRPRVSAIWGRFDDYTSIFEASDARLRA
jgi:hypothetical protein